jgi:hypothetical protein
MLWVVLCIALAFFCGWLSGLLFEYLYHWLMHKLPIASHMRHHKEFFKLQPDVIARNARCLGVSFTYAGLVFVVLLPLVLLVGWFAVLAFFAGAFWHLVIFYEIAHATIHYDAWLPRFIRERGFYDWWKRCHLCHHWDKPHNNYSVTAPFLMDVIMGTFSFPRPSYPPLPRRGKRDH